MEGGFLTAPIFGDREVEGCFGDIALTASLIRVECALAAVQGRVGIVPASAAEAINAAEKEVTIDPDLLSRGVASTGVPVPALVAALREAVGTEAGDWVHWGATSQDIVDCGLGLCYGTALTVLQSRLSQLIDVLQQASTAHGDVVMLARTRGQLATPITFGLRIAQWAQPLITYEAELPMVRSRALRVQFGGASGSQAAVAPHGPKIAAGLAEELGLAPGPPWHTDRSGLRRLAGWLADVVAALAKMAQDLAISARGEVAEVRAGAGGGSSTMPHKSNPVTAEAILSAHQIAIACEAGLQASAVHAEERDGGMWPVEWMLLPRLFVTAGATLAHATQLAQTVTPDAETMRARVDAEPAVLAEAAVFALAGHLGRQEAERRVKAALADPEPLLQALEARESDTVDWESALDFAPMIAASARVAEEIFAARATP